MLKRVVSLFVAIVMVGLMIGVYNVDTTPKAAEAMTTYTEKTTYAYGESITVYLC